MLHKDQQLQAPVLHVHKLMAIESDYAWVCAQTTKNAKFTQAAAFWAPLNWALVSTFQFSHLQKDSDISRCCNHQIKGIGQLQILQQYHMENKGNGKYAT
jgi:hypothetical protein